MKGFPTELLNIAKIPILNRCNVGLN